MLILLQFDHCILLYRLGCRLCVRTDTSSSLRTLKKHTRKLSKRKILNMTSTSSLELNIDASS